MPSFAGLRGTGSFSTGERPQNFREMILWMNPNGRAPLFALTARMKKTSTDDPQIHWWNEVLDQFRCQLNDGTNMTDTDTTVVCDNFLGDYDATILTAGDVLQVEPATQPSVYSPANIELVKVTSVTDANTFEISRGFAGTTAAAILDNAYFTRVGSSHAEGSLSPSMTTSNPVKYTNYTQIFKTAVEQTGTSKETNYRTGDAWKNDKRRKSFTHSEKIEQALFWGIASEATGSNGQPERTLGGLRSMIQSHVNIYSTNPTIDTFIADVSPCFDYESDMAGDERIVYCGNEAINYLNKLVASDSSTRVQYKGEIDIYGQKLFTFRIPQGTLAFKTHPLFNTHPAYSSSMFVINPAGLTYRPLRNRDTKFQDNIQPPDADYVKGQWLTECTFMLDFERTFAYIGNFKTNV